MSKQNVIWTLVIAGAVLTYLSAMPPPDQWTWSQWCATGAAVIAIIVSKATDPFGKKPEDTVKLPLTLTVLLLAVALATGCAAKTRPDLPPTAQKQLDSTEVGKRVGRLMDAAIDAEQQGLLTRNQTRAIVQWATEASQVLLVYPDGWGPVLAKSWGILKEDPAIKPKLQANLTIATAVSLIDLALAAWMAQTPPVWAVREDLCSAF